MSTFVLLRGWIQFILMHYELLFNTTIFSLTSPFYWWVHGAKNVLHVFWHLHREQVFAQNLWGLFEETFWDSMLKNYEP